MFLNGWKWWNKHFYVKLLESYNWNNHLKCVFRVPAVTIYIQVREDVFDGNPLSFVLSWTQIRVISDFVGEALFSKRVLPSYTNQKVQHRFPRISFAKRESPTRISKENVLHVSHGKKFTPLNFNSSPLKNGWKTRIFVWLKLHRNVNGISLIQNMKYLQRIHQDCSYGS